MVARCHPACPEGISVGLLIFVFGGITKRTSSGEKEVAAKWPRAHFTHQVHIEYCELQGDKGT